MGGIKFKKSITLSTYHRLKRAKQKARQEVWKTPGLFEATSFRTFATGLTAILLWLLGRAILFDAQMRAYEVAPVRYLTYVGLLLLTFFFRALGEWLLDHCLAPTSPHPWQAYVKERLHILGYTSLPFLGLVVATAGQAPDPLVHIWQLITFMTFLWAHTLRFGRLTPSAPRWTSGEKGLFYLTFFFHDLLNLLSFGLYGFYLLPYKRQTEINYLQKG